MKASTIMFALMLTACAGNQVKPRTISSADSLGYATEYPAALAAAAERFQAHREEARKLAAALPSHAPSLQPADDATLYLRVIEEADADGKRESYARARQDDRTLREFWSSERGPLASRVSAAVQKQQQAEQQEGAAGTPFDAQPTIQRSLRDGIDRPLDKRLHEQSEAERLLERYRTRFTNSTWQATQRVAAELTQLSYLVNIALSEDVEELERLHDEQSAVADTLRRGHQDEQAILAASKGAEQRASRDRLTRIEASQKALSASTAKSEAALRDQEQQLKAANDEYELARETVEAVTNTAAPRKG